MMYKLYYAGHGTGEPNAAMTVGEENAKSFLFDANNPDYQDYLKWVAEGNTPQPASN